jgi:sulfur carrier protein ThiS
MDTGTEKKIHLGIAPQMGETKWVDVRPGTTIKESLDSAGISSKEVSVLLNDDPVDLDTIITEELIGTEPIVTLIEDTGSGR